MQNKNMSLPISFSVNNEISDENNRFINVTIDVLHTGLNYNGSIFSKEVVDENTPQNLLNFTNKSPSLGEVVEDNNEDDLSKAIEDEIRELNKN